MVIDASESIQIAGDGNRALNIAANPLRLP